MLDAHNLTRTSGDKTLLNTVSISVKAGDQIALIGASGSGKTVLLRSLAMLDPLESGNILWQGTEIADDEIPKYRSRVMYLHQQPALKDGTVDSVLREPFHLKLHQAKTYSRDNAIQLLATLSKPVSFLDQQHTDLSGGESQIAALLRAIQLEPNIMLLDEPTSALDSTTTKKVESILIDWVQADDHRAFVWITHDSEQAQRVSHRTLRVSGGRLEDE